MTAQLQKTPAARQFTALALAAMTTLAMLSTMVGLADGYRHEQWLAQAASQPMAAATPVRKPLNLRG